MNCYLLLVSSGLSAEQYRLLVCLLAEQGRSWAVLWIVVGAVGAAIVAIYSGGDRDVRVDRLLASELKGLSLEHLWSPISRSLDRCCNLDGHWRLYHLDRDFHAFAVSP